MEPPQSRPLCRPSGTYFEFAGKLYVVATKNNKLARLAQFLEKNWFIVFVLIILVSVIVRIYGITKASIWHDEGFSAMLASRDWIGIWQGSARDVHPPLYYGLLHAWTLIFGNSVLALRSLSATCGVVVVALGYLITFKISKKHTVAMLAGVFLALNPFLVRYSQEARMYGVLGVFLLVAMLGLIIIIQNNRNFLGYLLYILGVAAGLYTHYFTALVVISFWGYVLVVYLRNKKDRISLLTNWRWWMANIMAFVLFLPWLPNMIKQLTRAQGLGWLPKASLLTFNDTFWQFFTFTDAHKIWQPLYWAVPLLVLAVIIYTSLKDKSKERFSILLILFTLLPVFLAIAVSFARPIFHERYFVFSAIGFCLLLAFTVSYIFEKNKYLAVALAALIILTQAVGLRNVNSQANHKMGQVMSNLNANFTSGDIIISGELYTYFDGSYYNNTGAKIYLYTQGGRPNGYGESGLIYDKDVYVDSYNQFKNGRVWLIGKTGQHDYYSNIPSNWKLVDTYTGGYSELRLYQIQ